MHRSAAVAAFLLSCSGSTPPPAPPSTERPPFSPGDVVEYAVESSDGNVVGRVHSRYDEAGGKRTVVTRVAVEDRTVEYATTLASDLAPIAFKRLSSIDGRMTISFEADGYTRVTALGTDEVPSSTRMSVVPKDDLVLLALAIERSQLAPGQSGSLSILGPDSSEPQHWAVQVYADAERRTIVQLPGGKAVLDGRGRIAELVTADGRTFRRVEVPGEPPELLPVPVPREYVRPTQASWIDREIVIPVKDGQLAGVLSEPRLRSRWKKNVVPGIVFLSDRPLQNRHGFTAGADYGTWQIFDHLTEQGFAVLRVDDRGAGGSKSSIAADRASLDVQREDALTMIEWMRRQQAVDGEKIFLFGHGTGAVPAMMAAAQADLTGLVLIAPPFRAAEKTITALVEEVAEPVAVFQGFKDFEVSWREDAKPLVDAFPKKQAKLFVYEFVDHLLKVESGTSSPASYADAGRRVDAAVLDDLVGWLTERAR